MLYPQPPASDDKSRLIREHMYMADILVGRMMTQVPAFMNRDDMKSAAMVGLIDAANKFDATKNIQFKTFAEHRIRGAILDEMRKLDWFSRTLRDKYTKISRAISDLENRLGRDPDDYEVAEELELSLDEYQSQLAQVSHLGCVSLHETLDHSEEGATFLDQLETTNPFHAPGHRLEAEELTRVIAEVLESLNEKERQVISLLYYEELTQKEIAEVMGLSEGRVSQLHSQALIKLKNKVRNQITPY
ncbi:MAG: FliA/WhiG family RNA polymerase sigma factor [Desulfobulbaceae bacterium]|jgi:RNA polymerase sigma factor for flagellar operon FliA|nr:FliA/WhiG family RNA polymerase sigma factor [Desulfobulbaceae bacterium]